MRILTFLHSFEPGGVERIALRLVRSWRENGSDAPLFMGRVDGPMRGELADGLSCEVPRQPFFGTARWETIWMIATLPRTIRRLRPDLLFCAGNSYTVVAVAMRLMLGRRCPPIVAKISNDLDRPDMPWAVRKLYRIWLRVQGRFIDHFVGMEEPMRREIADRIGPTSGAITIIPDPALTLAQIALLRAANPSPLRSGPGRRFVAIGRLARQKNFPLMLKAFAEGRQPHDRLTIYGDGPERPALERLAARLKIEAFVHFMGHVPDPASRLPEHDIFLLSSDYEGVPAVLMEALAADRAIIATHCSRSIATLLKDGALGQLIPVGDRAAFAQAIVEADGARRDSSASLKQARRFSIEHAASAYLACFATVEKSRSGATAALASPCRHGSGTTVQSRT